MGNKTRNVLASAGSLKVGSILAERDAAREERKARKAQERLQRFRTQRERRRQVNEAIRARSGVVAETAATGTAQTSAAITGAAQPLGQAGTNISELNVIEQQTQEISERRQNAEDFRQQSRTFQAIGQAGQSVAGLFV